MLPGRRTRPAIKAGTDDYEPTVRALCDLALIIVLARILGAVAQRLSQPAVIGEVLAGILLGPTFLGHSVPEFLFPLDIRPMLTALADVGMAVFMFIVGLELDRKILRGTGRLAVTVAVSCIVLPFGLGTLLALTLVDDHAPGHRLGFVLFMGTAMSVTAFPVLARILTDRGCSTPRSAGWRWPAPRSVTCSPGACSPPWWSWSAEGWRPVASAAAPAVRRCDDVGGPSAAAQNGRRRRLPADPGGADGRPRGASRLGAITERIGLHFIFGAFLFGVVMPKESTERLRADIIDRIGDVSGQLLQPVFFIIVGLKVDLSDLGGSGWLDFALILLVAVTGKFVGAFLSARAFRVTARQSAVLATLMNTRG
ncbi:cation:proton antiporter [Streptomyces nogalater]